METFNNEFSEKIRSNNQVYCDRLSWAILPKLLRIKTQSSKNKFSPTLFVLDEINSDWRTFLIARLIKIIGFTVKEVPFLQ